MAMVYRKRNYMCQHYVAIFLLGVAVGGCIFRYNIQTFLNGCIKPLFERLHATSEEGQDERNYLLVGVLRQTTDPNETGVIRKLITSSRAHAKVFCTSHQNDSGDLYIHPKHLHHIYPYRYLYEWFVLTANAVVDTQVLGHLVPSVSSRGPVALLHRGCANVSVLVVNQAALLLLSEHELSEQTRLCPTLQGARAVIVSLHKVWRQYERKHTVRNINIDYNYSLVFPLQKEELYNILIRYQQQKITLLRQKLASWKRQINSITAEISPAESPLKNRVLNSDQNSKHNQKEWSFINNTFVHSLDNTNAQPTENVHNRGRQLILNVSRSAEQYTCVREPWFAYQRVDVGAGVVHVIVKDNITCTNVYKTIQPFEGYRFREETKTKDRTLVIVLPLFKRSLIFGRFIKRLYSVGLDYKGTLVLQVVLFKDKSGDYRRTLKYVRERRGRIVINVVMAKGKFSRAKAIVQGLENLRKDVRVLLMDVDMMFTVEFLDRVVKATIKGKQAYFPVQFSRYDPDTILNNNATGKPRKRHTFSEELGRWRYFSFGIAGIYKSDIVSVGNFDTEVKGWGIEDVFFYEKCVTSHLLVFRSADPGLWHMYHSRHCQSSLTTAQLYMCQQSRLQLETSQQSLAAYVLRLIH